MAAAATGEDGKAPGELRQASLDSLQESLKKKRMKIEKDRSAEENRKSADVRANFGLGSTSSSTTPPSSEYTQVRLREGKEDVSRGMVRSSPQWEEEASFHAGNEESRQGCAETCNRSNDTTFSGDDPLLYAVTNEDLENQDSFQSSVGFESARETSPTQFVVKNGVLQENDVFQSSKSSTCSDKASQSRSLRKDALRPSKSSRASGETSPLTPSPLHVRNHAMEKEDDPQASKPSRWSKEISPNMEKPSLFQVENHVSNKKDGFKGSKVSRWSEEELPSEERVSPFPGEFQASKVSRWSEVSPSAENPLSLHLKYQTLQKKEDFRASKASRLSVETSANHKKQSSFHAKDQQLLTKAYAEVSKPSRWSEMASPNDKRLSSSHLKDQNMQNKDDRKPSKRSRWSEETSPSEENISSSHVQNHFTQKRSDLLTVKVSRWSEETSPREEKQSSVGVKQAGLEALKTSRWLEEASPSEEKTSFFGIVDEDLKKKDVSDGKSGLLTNDDDVRDQPNENAKIKSELGEVNGAIGPLHSRKNSSFALESLTKSSRWEEEDSPYGERASLFHVRDQEMQEKDFVETRSEHETDDKEGIKFDDSESDDHMKTETDLGEISGVNEHEDSLVEVCGYQKESDMDSSIQDRDKGSHDAYEDEEGISFLPEEIDSRDCKIDMLKSCRRVEEFEMVKKINEGTYGVVYKAKDKTTGEIMALKKVKMEKERDGFPMTSLREINILLSIKHPCIVNVKEVVVGNSMDSIYMVMEYMEHDLKRFMGTLAHPFSQSEVKWLMLKLFEGIKHLHDNWVLHRDLKTSNILLNNDGELKICDFGMARQYGSPLKTYTSLVVTLWYRSPELLLGCKEYSTAVDMWSLGCIMGELLSKEALFSGKNEVDQLDKIFRTLGTPDETIWPDFPNLPGVKCSFVKQRFNRLREKFPPTAFAGGVTLSNKGFDLLSRLLMYDPKKRITSEDALNHEWFREFPLPKMPELSSSKRAGASPWR